MSDFPDSPTIGDTHEFAGRTYQWTGTVWAMISAPAPGPFLTTRVPNCSVGETPPPAPVANDFWWDSSTGMLFIWYDDGNTSQWVVTNPGRGGTQGPPGPRGPQGPPGIPGPPGTAGGTGTAGVPNYAGMRAYTGPATDVVAVAGRLAPGDGGGGSFSADLTDLASVDDGGSVLVDASNRRWKRQFEGAFEGKWWGVSIASLNNGTAIAAVLSAVNARGGGSVHIGGQGIIWTTKVTMYSRVRLFGDGPGVTTLKLIAGQNTDLIYGDNSDALWGTNSNAGIEDWCIENMTLDGNRAAQTAGSGLAIYGQRGRLRDVYLKDLKDYGVRTEWGIWGDFSMEPDFRNVRVDTCGKHGWLNQGAHDMHVFGFTVINASMEANNAYDGFHFLTNVTGRFIGLHSWNDPNRSGGMRQKNALYCNTSCDFSQCHFEGGASSAVHLGPAGTQCTFDDTCNYYNTIGGNVLINVNGPLNTIRGSAFNTDTIGIPTPLKAVLMGGDVGANPGSNTIDLMVTNCNDCCIDFFATTGYNTVNFRGYNNAGVLMKGTPDPYDAWHFHVAGPGGGYISRFIGASEGRTAINVAAAGTTPGTAAPLISETEAYFIVTASPTANGVMAPSAKDGGGVRYIYNYQAETVYVYPQPSEGFGAIPGGGAVVLPTGCGVILVNSGTIPAANSFWMPFRTVP